MPAPVTRPSPVPPDAATSSATSSRPHTPRQQRLLDELLQLFLAEGFLHFTMDEIAERLRCSKKTLYQIASRQDDLFIRVIERWLDDVRGEGWAAADRATDRFEAIKGYLNAALGPIHRASSGFQRDLVRWPPARACLQDHQRRRADGLVRLLEAASDEGLEVPHVKLLAELMLGVAQRLVDPDFLLSMNVSLSEGFEVFYRTLEHGLFSRSAKPMAKKRSASARRPARV